MTDLTKWPRLLVVGKPVSQEQADEILVRTNSWYLSSNDRAFERAVYSAAGIEASQDQHGFVQVDWDSLDAWQKAMGVLDLSYLNNSQILSSWIGGAHGWCDWEGNIGCSTWNIGKYPSVESVQGDWDKIAAAFPYLTLDAQLVPDEGEAEYPAVQWRIEGGKAHLVEPTGLLRPVGSMDEGALLGILMGNRSERGVSLFRLTKAIERVRASQC